MIERVGCCCCWRWWNDRTLAEGAPPKLEPEKTPREHSAGEYYSSHFTRMSRADDMEGIGRTTYRSEELLHFSQLWINLIIEQLSTKFPGRCQARIMPVFVHHRNTHKQEIKKYITNGLICVVHWVKLGHYFRSKNSNKPLT